ncbi:MAG TPA: hypothetical protein VGH28_07140 [Polyangiaceae bacterium]
MIRGAVAYACALSACQLVLPIYETDDAGVDATSDAAVDAPDDDAGRVQDNQTVFCGPSLECSRSNLSIACCVLFNADSGLPPENYRYECVDNATCAADQGKDSGAAMITCDDGTDCPNPADVCCWASTLQPRVTYCFPPSSTNCIYEVCNPDAATPCIDVKHIGWKCVPSGTVDPFEAPLGYHVCVPPDAG